MNVTCKVCGGKADANLCRPCTAELQRAFAEMPALITDLSAVATRQASGPMGFGDPRRQWDEPPAAGSLPSTPWVFSPGAADQLWAARNTITTWVRHLVETRRADPPELGESLSGWLVKNLDAVRLDEAAGEMYDEFVYLRDAMDEAIVGRPGEAEFFGKCDQGDIRVDSAVFVGPQCQGLARCAHHSCGMIRGDETVLVTRATTCGADLYGEPGEVEIACPGCGTKYPVADRKKAMREALPDKIGTITEVAGALTTLDRPVHVQALISAIRRGLITVRGVDPHNHRLVRFGDVEAYLERVAEWAAKRRKHTAA